MKHLFLIVVVALFVVSLLFGQQPTLTRLVTVAGDSTTKLISRGAMDYLSNGVIWVSATDFVGTGKQYMYLSLDNGVTWSKSTVFNNPGYTAVGITGVAAKDANICNVITATGEIFRTTNGGVKWDTASATYSQVYAFGDGIRFVSGDTMVAYGDNDEKGLYVARSFDAGKTWTRVPNVKTSLPGDSLNMDQLYESQASYAQGSEVFGRNIWLTLDNTTGDPGSILKSTDAGATWSWFRITLPGGASIDNRLQSITFKDANNGFGVCRQVGGTAEGFRNYLVKTSDGGRSWSDTISIEPTHTHIDAKPMTVRAIRGTNTVIAVGFGGPGATSTSKAWNSNDNGTTWASLNAPSPVAGSDLRNVAFGANNKGIMVGYQNWVTFAIPTSVETEHNTVPTGFALEQNYPNPFNPTTKISYTVPKASFVELKVCDLLGRTVATLVSSEQVAGTHSVVFDAKGLASGAYLYTMKAGDFTATKSLVLVK